MRRLLVFLVLVNILISLASSWSFIADFEDGTSGARAYGESGYNGVDTGSQTSFDNSEFYNGYFSSLFNWTTPDVGYSQCTGQINFPEHVFNKGEIWIRAYYKFENDWSWENSDGSYGTKILRIHNRHADGTNGKYNSIYTKEHGNICVSMEPSRNDYEYCSDVGFDIGVWQSIEFYVKLNSENGIVRVWKNGGLIHEVVNQRTIEVFTDVSNYAFIMSTWNGGVGQNQKMWVDEIVATTDNPGNIDDFGNFMIGPVERFVDNEAESYCGDLICDANEGCSSCEIDCGGCITKENCSDGILNQDEVGVDCGGVCLACGVEVSINDLVGYVEDWKNGEIGFGELIGYVNSWLG